MLSGLRFWFRSWRRRVKRDLNDFDLRWLQPSIVIAAGQEVDLDGGRFNVIRVEKDGVLNLTGPVSCYRFELRGGRIHEFIKRDCFYTSTFSICAGSIRSMRRRVQQ